MSQQSQYLFWTLFFLPPPSPFIHFPMSFYTPISLLLIRYFFSRDVSIPSLECPYTAIAYQNLPSPTGCSWGLFLVLDIYRPVLVLESCWVPVFLGRHMCGGTHFWLTLIETPIDLSYQLFFPLKKPNKLHIWTQSPLADLWRTYESNCILAPEVYCSAHTYAVVMVDFLIAGRKIACKMPSVCKLINKSEFVFASFFFFYLKTPVFNLTWGNYRQGYDFIPFDETVTHHK